MRGKKRHWKGYDVGPWKGITPWLCVSRDVQRGLRDISDFSARVRAGQRGEVGVCRPRGNRDWAGTAQESLQRRRQWVLVRIEGPNSNKVFFPLAMV